MDRKWVLSKVEKCIYTVLGEDVKVTENTNLEYDLNADSLDTIELIMELEDEFDISIPDDEAERIGGKVRDIVDVLMERYLNDN